MTAFAIALALLAAPLAGVPSAEAASRFEGLSLKKKEKEGRPAGKSGAKAKKGKAAGGSRFKGLSLKKKEKSKKKGESPETGEGEAAPPTGRIKLNVEVELPISGKGEKSAEGEGESGEFADAVGEGGEAGKPPESAEPAKPDEKTDAAALQKRNLEALDKIRGTAQKGLDEAFGNMGKANEAIKNLAPGIGPRKVDEDFLIPMK